MQLTKHTDFAFRVLIYLASKPDEDLSQIQKIADDFAISRSHVMKVVQKLANHGFIASIRGQGGGLRLAKPATEINLREIVELMEATLSPVNCHQPLCLINNSCELKTYLHQAQEKYLAHLAQFHISDLISHPVRQALISFK